MGTVSGRRDRSFRLFAIKWFSMGLWKIFLLWGAGLLAAVILVFVCIRFFDYPVASFFLGNVGRVEDIGRALSGPVVVATQMIIILSLAIARVIRGSLPDLAKAVLLACCASLSAYSANEFVLKLLFGRQNPSEYFLTPMTGVFHFFHGGQSSSFPSSHMVVASAFVGVLMRLYPRMIVPFAMVLFVTGAVLVIGGWHFLGDVVGGAFVGGTAGLLAGELWSEHVRGSGPALRI